MAKRKTSIQIEMSTEVRSFAEDLYDYVWDKYIFLMKHNKNKMLKLQGVKFSRGVSCKDEPKCSDIGKAVLASQYFLREYFRKNFDFVFSKDSFKHDVKLLWFHWLENRKNIFVKVIDTLAIITEAFLYCDYYSKDFDLNLDDAIEWFIEWFNEHLAAEFFSSGGWEQLKYISEMWYKTTVVYLKENVCKLDIIEYRKISYTCLDVHYLRTSSVAFPIPKHSLCDKCIDPDDESLCHTVAYVRILNETSDVKALKDSLKKKNTEQQIKRKFSFNKKVISKNIQEQKVPHITETLISGTNSSTEGITELQASTTENTDFVADKFHNKIVIHDKDSTDIDQSTKDQIKNIDANLTCSLSQTDKESDAKLTTESSKDIFNPEPNCTEESTKDIPCLKSNFTDKSSKDITSPEFNFTDKALLVKNPHTLEQTLQTIKSNEQKSKLDPLKGTQSPHNAQYPDSDAEVKNTSCSDEKFNLGKDEVRATWNKPGSEVIKSNKNSKITVYSKFNSIQDQFPDFVHSLRKSLINVTSGQVSYIGKFLQLQNIDMNRSLENYKFYFNITSIKEEHLKSESEEQNVVQEQVASTISDNLMAGKESKKFATYEKDEVTKKVNALHKSLKLIRSGEGNNISKIKETSNELDYSFEINYAHEFISAPATLNINKSHSNISECKSIESSSIPQSEEPNDNLLESQSVQSSSIDSNSVMDSLKIKIREEFANTDDLNAFLESDVYNHFIKNVLNVKTTNKVKCYLNSKIYSDSLQNMLEDLYFRKSFDGLLSARWPSNEILKLMDDLDEATDYPECDYSKLEDSETSIKWRPKYFTHLDLEFCLIGGKETKPEKKSEIQEDGEWQVVENRKRKRNKKLKTCVECGMVTFNLNKEEENETNDASCLCEMCEAKRQRELDNTKFKSDSKE